MPRDITPTNRAVVRSIEALGFRVCVGYDAGVWVMTAKDDGTGHLHIVKGEDEHEAICELAASVGVELADG